MAAIAALARSYNPGWTASGTRQQLIFSGTGTHSLVDALVALGITTLNASIAGPSEVPAGEYCTWYANVTGGGPQYQYQWSGVLSGTGPEVSGTLYSSGTLNLTVTDDVGQQDGDQLYITVTSGEEEECEQ